MAHRPKTKTLSTSIEFLRRLEEYHRYVSSSTAHVRVGTPHFAAIMALSKQLQECYCAISGDAIVPWALDRTSMPKPRPWELPDDDQDGTIEPCADVSPDITPGPRSTPSTD